MAGIIKNTAVVALTTALCLSGADALAYEYNVTPSAIRPRWSGAKAGEWTFDREAAFANAKRDGKYTIVMFTGSWWCPYCQTCEAKVLTSKAWADYVAENGYYLVECDYPYRFPVPEGQEWKGTSPLGDGWGFQCWLYDAGYLAENGLTADEGLAAIQDMYDYQDAMALIANLIGDFPGRRGQRDQPSRRRDDGASQDQLSDDARVPPRRQSYRPCGIPLVQRQCRLRRGGYQLHDRQPRDCEELGWL